ncbi:MAG: YraN family protein [Methyloprofundus sp.]|nr:YraN family protein [Methyloprofundus sp.]
MVGFFKENFAVKKANEGLSRLEKGTQYEDLALKFLLVQGLTLIARNYRCQCGELDLLMAEKGALIIVEVRYRKNNRYGSALESVTKTKQTRIIAATKHYIVTHKIDQPIRFDVLAITGDTQPDWVKNAF